MERFKEAFFFSRGATYSDFVLCKHMEIRPMSEISVCVERGEGGGGGGGLAPELGPVVQVQQFNNFNSFGGFPRKNEYDHRAKCYVQT